jgi:biotin transport system permease protein
MLSLYLSQRSWLHAIPANAKLLVLLAASVLLLPAQNLWILGSSCIGVGSVYLSLGRPGRDRLAGLGRTLGPMLLFLGLFQWLALIVSQGWEVGNVTGLVAASTSLSRLVVLILLADLVTLSTPTQELISALRPVLAPLRLIGLSPQRLSLAMALMLRWVNLLQKDWSSARTAFAARGCYRPKMKITGPVMHRAAQTAQNLSEALAARQSNR